MLPQNKKDRVDNKKEAIEVIEVTKDQEMATEMEKGIQETMDSKNHTKKLSNQNMIMSQLKHLKEIDHNLHLLYHPNHKQENSKENKFANLSKMDLL
jgi:hypothetical protein